MFPVRQILFVLAAGFLASCSRGDRAAHSDLPIDVDHELPTREVAVKDLRRPQPVMDDATIPVPVEEERLGAFKMTYYWVASEPEDSKPQVPIFDKKCRRIAKVSRRFQRRLNLEGSGQLKDGRTVTAAGNCKCGSPCFFVADDTHEWGAGVASRPLKPFRSIAVDSDEIPIGTAIYVEELDGLTMPGPDGEGGFVHDGCVVADDRGGGVRGKQIDFFAARKQHYKNFFRRHKITEVNVYAGGERCRDRVAEHNSGRS